MITLKTPKSSFSFIKLFFAIVLIGALVTACYALYTKIYQKKNFFNSNNWISGYNKLNA